MKLNHFNHASIQKSIHHNLTHLHTLPKAQPITHFVPSSPASASPLRVFKYLVQSEDGFIKILRLIETGLKSYIYFNTWVRHSNLKSQKNSSRFRTQRILIGLSFISIIHKSKELIKKIQAKLVESQFNKSESFLQQLEYRTSSSSQIKSALEFASNSLEIIIDLLDNLTFFNHLSLLNLGSINRVAIQISNMMNVMLNILNYSKSSIEKAELWKIGKENKKLMLETDQIIKLNQRAIELQSNLSLSPESSTIRPTRSEHEADQKDLNKPSSIQDQVDLNLKLNRTRKLILKNCRRSLDRIFWSRVVWFINGLVSTYDLLEAQCVSHGVRTLFELISSTLDFRLSYSLALQSYSADHYH